MSPSALRTTLFVAFVAIFVATAVLTLLAITGVVEIREGYLNALFSSLILEIVAAVIALFRSASFFGSDVGGAVRLIAGSWWEHISDKPGIVLSFVRIDASARDGRLVLEGEAYDETGRRVADWTSSRAWIDPDTLQLVYLWSGSEARADRTELSGCGVMRFRADGAKPATRAYGWFVSPGDVAASGGGRALVEMRRAADDDHAIMTGSDTGARRDLVAKQLGER